MNLESHDRDGVALARIRSFYAGASKAGIRSNAPSVVEGLEAEVRRLPD
jgi:hypothetical protein